MMMSHRTVLTEHSIFRSSFARSTAKSSFENFPKQNIEFEKAKTLSTFGFGCDNTTNVMASSVKTFALNWCIDIVNKTSDAIQNLTNFIWRAIKNNSVMSESQPEPVVFKPKKKKNLRTRIKSSDEEDDDNRNREETL